MRSIDPWFGLTGVAEAAKTVVVVGCPFGSADTFRAGAHEGPEAIRTWARTAEAIDESGRRVQDLRVVDYGDANTDDESGEGRWRAIESTASRALQEHPGAFLLGLGGDHAVTPPLATAARGAGGRDLGFVLLDAHADCFVSYDGDDLSHACVVPRAWDRGGFEPAKTCIAGVRSYAAEELDIMATAGLSVSAKRWHELGAPALADAIAESTGNAPLYVSLDVDVLDPSCAPGTGYPVAGGPDLRALLALLVELWRRQSVVALDLVEVAPSVDPTGITAANAAHILLQVLGHVSAA